MSIIDELRMQSWNHDVNNYARWLSFRDQSTTLMGIEHSDKRLQDIRNKWPNQSKVFDQMDREQPT